MALLCSQSTVEPWANFWDFNLNDWKTSNVVKQFAHPDTNCSRCSADFSRFSADFRAICCTVSTGFPVVWSGTPTAMHDCLVKYSTSSRVARLPKQPRGHVVCQTTWPLGAPRGHVVGQSTRPLGVTLFGRKHDLYNHKQTQSRMWNSNTLNIVHSIDRWTAVILRQSAEWNKVKLLYPQDMVPGHM